MTVAFDSDVNLTVEIGFDSEPFDNSQSFTDVSEYVRGITMRKGRSNELGQFVAGTCNLLLSNADNRFNPTQTGVYYDSTNQRTKIQPLKTVRVRATYNSVTYDLFYGFLDQIPVSYPALGADSVVTFGCVDAFKIFQSQTIQSVGWKLGQVGFSEIGSSTRLGYSDVVESSSVRVSRLLDSIGFPSALKSIQTGTMNVQQQAINKNLLAAMRECELAENAQFFIGPDGKATFRNRDYKLSNAKAITVQAIFDNSGSNLPYEDVVTSFDTNEVLNVYEWTRSNGNTQYVADADSINRYTAKTSTASTINTSDANVKSIIEQKISETSTPIERIDALEISPRQDTALWPKVLGLGFGDRVKVNITNPNGSTFSDEVWIESIEHNISSAQQNWNYNISLSPAGSSAWILGQAKLGEGTRFAYA
tara:strand:+ start:13451 stop:14713 length:1263 start_codon:yes stop_codon:yes gene_type:complete